MITPNEPCLHNVLFKPSIVLTKINHALPFGLFILKIMYIMTVYNDWQSVGSFQELDKHSPISFLHFQNTGKENIG